ncbi:MATE family efflux transporter [Haloparvum sedimenti]|uniref:MATE family efflux transporter n=1 Tax=Haloparvum sedimenti TaxID=1678448 RepID=UPI00071E73C9|nr:MATE family efflux transporter [Haloparvum sedimenti]
MFDLSQEEITEGSIPRALTVLAVPLIGMNLVHVVNTIVDTFWLGRLGENAVAAVGLNVPVLALFAAISVLTFSGTQIVVSQLVGGGDLPTARRATFNGVLLTLAVVTVVVVAVAPNARAFMSLLGADAALAGTAGLYLGTVLLFYPLGFASDTVEYAYAAVGDSRAGLHINVLTAATNLLLDPLLIFGVWRFPELGVRGAALASGIGMTVGAALTLVYVAGYRDTFVLTRESLRVDADLLREILKVGAPLGAQRVVSQVVRVLVIGLVTVAGGAAGVAAYTVGARVAGLAIVPATGLQQAAQSVIGQNLGAEQPARAHRTTTAGVAMIVGLLTVLGLFQWFFPGLVVAALVPGLTEAGRELTVLYLRILAVGYPAMGATYVLFAGFNGASRTKTSLAADLGKYWGIRFPIALLAVPAGITFGAFGVSVAPGLGWGVEAVFWAVTVSNVLGFLGVGAYYVYTTREGMFQRAAERASESAGDDGGESAEAAP